MTPAAFLEAFANAIANDGALILLVLLILVLGARKTWVWGYQLEAKDRQLTDERVQCIQELHDIRTERDQWRAAALWSMGHPTLSQRTPDAPLPEQED